MSEARVFVNGTEVCFWPYGYNSFWCDVTDVVKPGENYEKCYRSVSAVTANSALSAVPPRV